MEVFWKFFEECERYTLYHEASKVKILQISVMKMREKLIKAAYLINTILRVAIV